MRVGRSQSGGSKQALGVIAFRFVLLIGILSFFADFT